MTAEQLNAYQVVFRIASELVEGKETHYLAHKSQRQMAARLVLATALQQNLITVAEEEQLVQRFFGWQTLFKRE